MSTDTTRIAALIASYNRRETTLRCLRSLQQQRLPPGVTVRVVLVDDGSSDGTAQAVSAEFPDVRILHGSGNLYWNGAMRTAAAAAMSEGFQFYLLLNDDTHLHAGALATLLETSRGLSARGRGGAIVVGSTEAPDRSGLSYGGWRWGKRFFALRFEKVPPSSEPVLCDTFNGNCTLIPDATLRALGNLDPVFTHSMGDHDLGLRARRAGIGTYIAPGFVGTCERNEGRGAWLNPALPSLERWRRFLGPKGLPPREWLAFTSRHTGALWPLYFVNPYVKFWVRIALPWLDGHARAADPKRRSTAP